MYCNLPHKANHLTGGTLIISHYKNPFGEKFTWQKY